MKCISIFKEATASGCLREVAGVAVARDGQNDQEDRGGEPENE